MLIHIPKKRIIVPAQMNQNYGFKGEFRFLLKDLNGRVVQDTGWNQNLITDWGMDRVPNGDYLSRMHIGSGTTPPAVTDLLLDSWLAQASTGSESAYTSGVAPNYETWTVRSATFGQGVGTGTINEVGMTNGNTSTSNLFCRHVLGTPIVKGADNILEGFYKITIYPPLTDWDGVLDIGGINYNVKGRGVNYGSTPYGASAYTSMSFSHSFPSSWVSRGDGSNWGATLEDYPTGASVGNFGGTYWHYSYTPGTYYRDCFTETGLDAITVPIRFIILADNGGRQSFAYRFGQVVGDGPVPKDNEKLFRATLRASWSRYP